MLFFEMTSTIMNREEKQDTVAITPACFSDIIFLMIL